MEVWFDADGGLEHGDEWDRKIRGQIKECVLFLPVISANTEARHEGYFRIEWDLAAERARGIAAGVPFILPVVIDDTREPDALVPDRFRTVQWTRLRGGEVPPDVKARFLKLWSHRTGVLKQEAAQVSSSARAEGIAPRNLPEAGRSLRGRLAWVIAAVVAVAVVVFISRRHGETNPASNAGAGPATTAPAPSEADQDVQKARELIYDPDSGRTEFFLAEKLLKRATELAPLSGSAWGASALLNQYLFARAYDLNRERLVRSQADGENALRLDPRSVDALLALGLRRLAVGENAQAKDYLDRAQAADPQNVRVIIAQAWQLPDQAARGQMLLDMAARVPRPAELFYYAGDQFAFSGRFDDAAAALEHAIAAQPFWRTFVYRAGVESLRTADPVKMIGWLDRVPEIRRDEPRVAVVRYYAAMLQRDAATAVRVISDLAVDYLEDNFFVGPKAFLIAQAQELAGHPELATEQWQTAERIVREKMAADPAEIQWRSMLAVILAGEHRTAEARTVADACAADARLRQVSNHLTGKGGNTGTAEYVADAYARLGAPVRAIEVLRHSSYRSEWGGVSAALLAVELRWAPLHDQPGYAELVEEMKSAENRKPGAPSPAESPTKVDQKSVAVLAFANLSGDTENEYFSDGISEELLNVLAKIPGLKVAARTSAFYFKGKQVPMADIAKQLGVAYVVEGSVRKAGTQVRITAQLISAADGFHVWSDTFTRELKDIFAVQDEIAGLIAKNLQLKMGDTPRVVRTVDPEAHRLVLEGRYFWNLRNDEGFARAETAFVKAIEIDPKYAEAHSGLAGVCVIRDQYRLLDGYDANPADAGRGRAEAQRAIDLDPTLAEPHAVLGFGLSVGNRLAESEQEFQRALALNPNDPVVRCWHGNILTALGRIDESLLEYEKAAELDPLWFINYQVYLKGLVSAQRYGDALKTATRAAALRAETDIFIPSLGYVAEALLALGRKDEAVETARRARRNGELRPRWDADPNAIFVLRQAGFEREAEDYAKEVFARLPSGSYMRGWVLVALGRFDEALPFLGQTQPVLQLGIYWGTMWDPWREDPRFAQILAKNGRTEEYKAARATLAQLLKEQAARK